MSTLSLTLLVCATEEKRTAQSVRQRLWEFLAPAGLAEGAGSSPWLQAYRQLLQEEGADKETQSRALLMQLWATQVRPTLEERRLPMLLWLCQIVCVSRVSKRSWRHAGGSSTVS